MKLGVPLTDSALDLSFNALDTPKSPSLYTPSEETKILSSLNQLSVYVIAADMQVAVHADKEGITEQKTSGQLWLLY